MTIATTITITTTDDSPSSTPLSQPDAATELEEEKEERLEDLEIYRLDYETDNEKEKENDNESEDKQDDNSFVARAAGGEVLEPGDHVYMWCTMYTHHGIVLETSTPSSSKSRGEKNTNMDDKNENSKNKEKEEEEETQNTTTTPFVWIAEFTNVALEEGQQQQSFFVSASIASDASGPGNGVTGGFRFVCETNPSKWHIVKYRANPLECLSWRPGTCSAAIPSTRQTILTRIAFLRDCRHVLPDYHLLASNCETVAVWCMTGKWETLQGDRAVQATTGVMVAASAAVATMPFGLLAAAGMWLWHKNDVGCRKTQTEEALNEAFDWYAMGKLQSDFFDFECSKTTTTTC